VAAHLSGDSVVILGLLFVLAVVSATLEVAARSDGR
jgi:hypothetical protein